MKGKSKTLGLRIGSKELGEIVMVGVTNPIGIQEQFPTKDRGAEGVQQRKWFPADVPMAISGLWVRLSPRPCSGKDESLDKGLINHKTRDI